MAQIGWFYFSPKDREKIGTVLELLKPEGMVDELGVGIIRDAVADRLFPGITTLQTRARYFFIVPYILYEYQLLSPQKKKSKSPTKFLDEREHDLMWDLADKFKDQEKSGVIGITKKRGERIMKRPSQIYWNGIQTYNIIKASGLGLDSFLRSRTTENILELITRGKQEDDGSYDDPDAGFENLFNIRIPHNPEWDKDMSLDLTYNEADILKTKILENCGDRLIGELLINGKLYKAFSDTDEFMDFAKLVTAQLELTENIKSPLTIAHDFSEATYGAHIAYNYFLQLMKYGKEYFTEDWEEWFDNLKYTMISFNRFNPSELFEYPYAKSAKWNTMQFIVDFWNQIRAGNRDLDKYKELIYKQEWKNKGNKARLKWERKEEILEESWLGLRRLEYRYSRGKVILDDIKKGMEN